MAKQALKISDSVRIVIEDKTLNNLIKVFSENVLIKRQFNSFVSAMALEYISDHHEIPENEFKIQKNNFWDRNPLVFLEYDKTGVSNLISGMSVGGYVKFEFDDKLDNRFTISYSQSHSFKNFESCLPVAIFMKMIQDEDFVSLKILKGKKEYKNHIRVADGIYHVVLLHYEWNDSKNGNVPKNQYFDIVDNPTIDLNTLKYN